MASSTTKDLQKRSLKLANELILSFNADYPRLASFKLISPSLFLSLFESIFGLKLVDQQSLTDQQRYQLLIDKLSTLLDIQLDHIPSADLARKDAQTVINLLQICDAARNCLPVNRNRTVTINQVDQGLQTDPLRRHIAGCCFGEPSAPTSPSSSVHSLSVRQAGPSNVNQPGGDQSLIYEEEKAEEISDSVTAEPSPRSRRDNNGLARSDTLTLRALKSVQSLPRLGQGNRAQALADELRARRRDTFALELGLKLQEALKMEQKAAAIERHIDEMYNMEENPLETVRQKRAASARNQSLTRRRDSSLNQTRRSNSATGSKKSNTTGLISRNVNKSPSAEAKRKLRRTPSLDSFLERYTPGVELPAETRAQLRKMERQHRAFVDNLSTDMQLSRTKANLALAEAIERELARSAILRADIDRVERLERDRRRAICTINKASLMREERLSRAKLITDVNEYHREAASKYAAARSQQETTLKQEFAHRIAEDRSRMLEQKSKFREQEFRQKRRQQDKLEAIENFYRTERQAVLDAVESDREQLKLRLAQNSRAIYDAKKLYSQANRGIARR